MTQKFSKKEAIKFGWDTMRGNLGFFIMLLIILVLISFIPNQISEKLKDDYSALSFIITIIGWILSIIVSLGIIKITLRFVDNEKGNFSDLFSQYPLFFKYVLAGIIYNLIVFVGLILLIIPGIIWGIRYQFFSYFLVDKNFGPIEALKKSSEITKGAKWDLFLFGILLWLINVAGFFCLLFGLFATIPTTMLAQAFVYRKLLSHIEKVPMPENSVQPLS